MSLLGGAAAQVSQDRDTDVKSIPLRTHSLQAPYLDSDMQSRWFDFGGDTVVRTDQYVRLTPDKTSRSGWLFSRVPLTATNWEIEVAFKIHGSGTLYGDGMAMWITKQRGQQGPVFGSVDNFEGLGIFIDTYKNNRPGTVFPYVMAMLGDGTKSYDANNDGKLNELAGCSARGIRNPHNNVPTKAKLTYFQDKSLRLDLQYKTDGSWTKCFDVEGVKLPPVAYLGFSAETGELADNHDVVSVATKNLYSPSSGASGGPGAARPKAGATMLEGKKGKGYKKAGGGWAWFFFKFILFGCVVAGGYAGFTAYRMRQQRSRF
ncbi:legume-like lectin family-domain-containing protein [Lineolata rhizophorae]|uniref:Legume-like lectin family-domain-containing protein n=1 Tax=Lineolata rhizophorae TaxID=578093 RepID=A0A6A6NXI5_9PEZI|nr:legume-like lectin family-domain-containing protein [Lineolata rhizophorae]